MIPHHLRQFHEISLVWGALAVVEPGIGPQFDFDPTAEVAHDWMTLEGNGTQRRLSLDVGQLNAAFAVMDEPRAAEADDRTSPLIQVN